jgi:hypothetical protein
LRTARIIAQVSAPAAFLRKGLKSLRGWNSHAYSLKPIDQFLPFVDNQVDNFAPDFFAKVTHHGHTNGSVPAMSHSTAIEAGAVAD